MPKVIHVVRKFEPGHWGGIETHLLALIPRLERLGWTSEVHAPAELGTDGSAVTAAGAMFRTFRAYYPYLGMGMRERSALVASGGNLISFAELGRLLLHRRASVLHVHTLRRLGGVVRVASKLTQVPYAVTIHSPVRTQAEIVEQESANRLRNLFDLGTPFGWAVGARRVVQDADIVFIVNQAERTAWQNDRHGRHLERIFMGIDSDRATIAARADARRMIPGLGDAPFAAVVARLDPIKGQDIAIEAFARAAPAHWHLVLAGAATSREYAGKLRQQAAPLGERVHFVGNVTPTIARAIMAESKLVLVPSKTEAFGMVLLEAWAEGSMVLFSGLGGLGEIGQAAGATFGMVADCTVAGWAARIREVLADEVAIARERRESPERVARRFSWQSLAEQTAAAYRQATLGSQPS